MVAGRKLIGREGMKYDNKAMHDFVKCVRTATMFSFL